MLPRQVQPRAFRHCTRWDVQDAEDVRGMPISNHTDAKLCGWSGAVLCGPVAPLQSVTSRIYDFDRLLPTSPTC